MDIWALRAGAHWWPALRSGYWGATNSIAVPSGSRSWSEGRPFSSTIPGWTTPIFVRWSAQAREGFAVGHGECQVVDELIRRLIRPASGARGLCEHDHELCTTVCECDVSDTGVLRKRYESERSAVPARARLYVCNEELEV